VRKVAAAECEPQQTNMPAARQIIAVHATRIRKKDGQCSQFERLFVTSLTPEQATTQRLAQIIRRHWGIENRHHWRKDACWGEDKNCRVRTPNIACALALLRSALLLPALTAKAQNLIDLTERCAQSKRLSRSLLDKRTFCW